MIVVSYYTDPHYEKLAHRLIESLDLYGIRHDVMGVVDQGSWKSNTDFKASFILHMMGIHQEPVLWLDADALVYGSLEELDDFDCDLAFHRFRGTELLSGTVLFNQTPKALETVQAWVLKTKKETPHNDQRLLDYSVRQIQPKVYELGPEYCYIFDLSLREYPDISPVIEHFQESRKAKVRERRTQ